MASGDTYKDDLRAAYDADVERRNAMTPDPWRTDIVERFGALLTTTGTTEVLELGCGTGQLARHVADLGFHVTAIDLSPNNVEAARSRGVDAVTGDFADMPFPDGAFDAAFGIHSIIHVPEPELPTVFSEIRRVMRNDGLLLVVVWGGMRHEGTFDHEWLDPPRYFSFYTDDQILGIETPGFERISFESFAVEESDMNVQALTYRAIEPVS